MIEKRSLLIQAWSDYCDKAAHAHGTTPLGNVDVLCLKIVGAKDGGFGKKCHRCSRNEKTRRGLDRRRVRGGSKTNVVLPIAEINSRQAGLTRVTC
ncbi:MAG: hypothetical protein EBQ86_14590 [Betaproteobacteria bacterium]|nr:hypothetical protein [Betaproteobacteria bacterium]